MYRELLPWHTKSVNIEKKSIKKSTFESKKIRVLNWNVHKENHTHRWLNDFESLLREYDFDIVMFQEYKKINSKSILSYNENYGYDYLANIRFNKTHSGLITASKSNSISNMGLFSKSVEPLIKTPKLTLQTIYQFSNSKEITVINTHFINFVKLETFKRELKELEKLLAQKSEPIILAGDFNTWSAKRFSLLDRSCCELGLKRVEFEQKIKRSRLIKRDLDHIYYKDLVLEEFAILKDIKSSDHLPQIATFKFL